MGVQFLSTHFVNLIAMMIVKANMDSVEEDRLPEEELLGQIK